MSDSTVVLTLSPIRARNIGHAAKRAAAVCPAGASLHETRPHGEALPGVRSMLRVVSIAITTGTTLACYSPLAILCFVAPSERYSRVICNRHFSARVLRQSSRVPCPSSSSPRYQTQCRLRAHNALVQPPEPRQSKPTSPQRLLVSTLCFWRFSGFSFACYTVAGIAWPQQPA
jgi:hypothetical protein